jgi:ABC-type Mn2+/Zn2+ transport system permease subunit
VLDALDTPYLQRALLAGLLIAVPLGLLGCWVVLRGLAFYAHAVGVATFPGTVVGVALPVLGPFAGALLAAVGFSLAVSAAERDHRVRGGAVTGLALAVALAVGALLLTLAGAGVAPVEGVLFGSLLAVSNLDVLACAAVGAIGLAATARLLPRLAATTFDEEWAARTGAGDRVAGALLLGLVALVVVSALPAVGSLLVSALLVVPAATARLLTERLESMLRWAVGLCSLEVVGGLVAARALDVPPGAAVAALAGAGFALATAGSAAVGFGRRPRPA